MNTIINCFKTCCKPNQQHSECPTTKTYRHLTYSIAETPERIPECAEEQEDQEDPTFYCVGGYHPVKPGEMFVNRYTVVRKLGWGFFSTVWLCWDEQDTRHKALKIVRSAEDATNAAMNEITMLKLTRRHCADSESKIVQLLDYFTICGANGTHVCMVFDVLGDNLLKSVIRSGYKGLPLNKLRSIVRQVLEALDYLHTTCEMIHTDVKLENVCLDLSKSADDVAVTLADLGNACLVEHHLTHSIQTRPYRSPEVILGGNYSANADVWSTACMAFELATGDYLFPSVDGADQSLAQNENHLYLIVQLLGKIPKRFATASKYFGYFCTSKGKLIRFPNLKTRGVFEVLTADYKWDDDEARRFADFLRPMLAIDPNDRASAQVALKHKWLRV